MKKAGDCKTKLTIMVLGLLFIFFGIGNVSAATSNWSFNGYDILLNGKTFFSKGMCYYPLPIGNTSGTTPYGDYFYNFSGGDMVWQNIVMRDIPKMRAAGVNVVRLYAMWTCAQSDYTVNPLCTNKAHDIYHDRFLDLLYNNGDNPIYLLVGVYTENNWNTQPYQSQLENEYRRLATEMKDHPAVMGFMIGNELNAKFKSDPAFWQWVNKVGKMIKEIAPNKITTVALIDDGFDTFDKVNRIGPEENGKVMPYIDAWGINNYRGDSSSSGPNSGFTAGFWSGYKEKTQKPLLMTEWGVPASQHVPNEPYPSGVPQEMPDNAEGQEIFIKYHYMDMVQNATVNDGIGSGGMLFMWADQWDKQGCNDCSPEVHDGTPSGPTGNFPGNWTDEEWFGIQSLVKDPNRPWGQNWDVNKNQPYPADTLVERAAFTTMKKFFTNPDPELRTAVVGTATDGSLVPLRFVPQAAAATPPKMGKYSVGAHETAPWDDPDPLQATPSDSLRVTYSLLPNSLMGTDAEWYASAIVYPYKGAETHTVYNYLDGMWVKAADQTQVLSTTPSYAGELFQLQDYEMFTGSLAPGYYEFLFGLAVLRSDWTGYDLYFDGEAIEVKNN